MEEVNIYNTSQDNNSSYTYDYEYYEDDYNYEQDEFIMNVVTIIIICIGLPLTLVAIYAVYSLVKDDHVVPIYVINLLITDLIQLCCLITWVLPEDWILSWTELISHYTYIYCLVASIGFMVCIALERYLVIACPLWYCFRRTIKVSVLVRNDHVAPIFIINLLISDLIQLWCMIAKVAQLKDGMIADIFTHIYYFCGEVSDGFMWCIALKRYLVIACPLRYCFRRTIKISVVVCVVVWVEVQETILTFCCFLLLPLLIFFLGGTLKALSASISVHSDEKRRIVGMLVLVLLIYTLLFLPSIILLLVKEARYRGIYRSLFPVFLRLSPLADLFLYVFMRKGIIDKLLASVCCCKMDRNNINSPAVVMMNTYPQSATGGEGERERETIEGDV
ncbi:hypothetical protein ABVT39_008201 [Epinephelus coioides]